MRAVRSGLGRTGAASLPRRPAGRTGLTDRPADFVAQAHPVRFGPDGRRTYENTRRRASRPFRHRSETGSEAERAMRQGFASFTPADAADGVSGSTRRTGRASAQRSAVRLSWLAVGATTSSNPLQGGRAKAMKTSSLRPSRPAMLTPWRRPWPSPRSSSLLGGAGRSSGPLEFPAATSRKGTTDQAHPCLVAPAAPIATPRSGPGNGARPRRCVTRSRARPAPGARGPAAASPCR